MCRNDVQSGEKKKKKSEPEKGVRLMAVHHEDEEGEDDDEKTREDVGPDVGRNRARYFPSVDRERETSDGVT